MKTLMERHSWHLYVSTGRKRCRRCGAKMFTKRGPKGGAQRWLQPLGEPAYRLLPGYVMPKCPGEEG